MAQIDDIVKAEALVREITALKKEQLEYDQKIEEKERAKLSALEKEKTLLRENIAARNKIINELSAAEAKLESLIEKQTQETNLNPKKIEYLQKQIDKTKELIAQGKERIGQLNEEIEKGKERVKQEEALEKVRQKAISMVVNLYQKVKDKLMEIDQLNAKLVASTGQIFQRVGGSGQFAAIGLGVEKMNAAYEGLFINMTKFSDLTAKEQADLAISAGRMSRLGVEASTSGKNIDIMNKSLGMTAINAAKTQEKLAKAAIGAGIAPKKMLEDFSSAMSRLSLYGQKGTEMFEKMEKQAKALGVSVNDLNSVFGENMDTFEGTSQVVGDLNSLLGQNVFSVGELMGTDEIHRAKIVGKRLAMMGLNSETEKSMKLAVANALHIKDQNVLNGLLNNSIGEVEKQMAKKDATTKQLNKTLAGTVSFQENLSLIFERFALVFQPVFKVITQLILKFLGWFDALSNTQKIVAVVAAGIGVLLLVFGQFVLAGISFAFGLNLIGSAGVAAAPGLAVITSAAFALGFAVAAVGIAIAAVVYSIGLLADKFAKFQGDQGKQLAESFFYIAAGIAAIFIAASNPVGAAGLATLAGLAVAAGGLAIAVNHFFGDEKKTSGSAESVTPNKSASNMELQRSIDVAVRQSAGYLREIRDSLKTISENKSNLVVKMDGRQVAEIIKPIIDGMPAATTMQGR